MKKIEIKLKKILIERNMQQKELSELSGVLPNAVSAMCRQTISVININHLEKIMTALEIDDVRKIIHVEEVDDEN